MHAAWKTVIGAAAGAAVGYVLYRTIGCRTGACPITGNPYVAMAVYGLLGAILSAGR
jgi:outer membrane lipoprotein SlyB